MRALVIRLAAALALAGAPAPVAFASPPPATSERRIDVVLAAPPEQLVALEVRVREFLGRLPAQLHTTTTDAIEPASVIDDAGGDAFTKVWIDASGRGTAVRIYIVDAPADRILIRKVQLPNGLDEVAIDEIGLIVEASVDALLHGGTLGVTREVAAAELGVAVPIAASPPRRPAPSRRGALELVAGYTARAWGDRVVQHGPWLDIGVVARRRRIDVGAVLEASAALPTRVREGDIELVLVGGGLRALAHLAGPIARGWWWEGRLGAGLDVLRDRGRPLRAGAQGSPATTRTIGLVALRSGPAVALGRGRDRLVLRVHVTLDIEVAGVRYVTIEGTRVFDPWRARPGVVLALGWLREWPR